MDGNTEDKVPPLPLNVTLEIYRPKNCSGHLLIKVWKSEDRVLEEQSPLPEKGRSKSKDGTPQIPVPSTPNRCPDLMYEVDLTVAFPSLMSQRSYPF